MATTTLAEMIEAQQRLGDSVLAQAAAVNRLTTAIERLIAPFEQLRRDIYDIKTDRDNDNARIDLAIGRLNTDLALLLDNVKDAQTDVKGLTREVTAQHVLAPRDDRSGVERAIDRFERMSVTTKLIIVVLAVLAAASGWLTHLFIG